jgi:hypothetical protein
MSSTRLQHMLLLGCVRATTLMLAGSLLSSGCGPGTPAAPAAPTGPNAPSGQLGSPKDQTPKAKPGSEENPISITAEDLTAEFAKDGGAAKKKYSDKWLIVEGVLDQKPERFGQEIHVQLQGAKRPGSGQTGIVECIFGPYTDKAAPEPEKIDKLTKGQIIKIKCQFITYYDPVFIRTRECSLVEQ